MASLIQINNFNKGAGPPSPKPYKTNEKLQKLQKLLKLQKLQNRREGGGGWGSEAQARGACPDPSTLQFLHFV